MMAAVTTSMDDRTGRSLDEWVALVRDVGPDPLDQRAVRAWLRDEHHVPQNSQWAIADAAATAAGWQRPDVDGYTDALYAQKPGDTIDVVVLRGTERVTVRVTLGNRGS